MLTSLNEDDLSILYEWINDKDLVHYNSCFKPVTQNSHLDWYNKIINSPNIIIFAIRLIKENKIIGTCQLHSIHPVYRSAELQIRIGETDEQSKGYGSDAVKLLIQYGFKDLNLYRIELNVIADNSRAIKLYDRIGFKKEGVKRKACFINGVYKDLILMSVLKDEFINDSK